MCVAIAISYCGSPSSCGGPLQLWNFAFKSFISSVIECNYSQNQTWSRSVYCMQIHTLRMKLIKTSQHTPTTHFPFIAFIPYQIKTIIWYKVPSHSQTNTPDWQWTSNAAYMLCNMDFMAMTLLNTKYIIIASTLDPSLSFWTAVWG